MLKLGVTILVWGTITLIGVPLLLAACLVIIF